MTNDIKHISVLYCIIIGLLISNFIFYKKDNKLQPIIKGYKTIYKPSEVIRDTVTKDIIVFKDKKIIVDNTDVTYVNKYLSAVDSISKLNVVLDLSKIRQYKDEVDNDDINITIDSEVTGKLNWIKTKYTIKERLLPAPEVITKQSTFALYTGVEISNSLLLNSPNVKFDIGFQNKKGDIISGGYDINNNIYLGYKYRLINIIK